MKELLGHYQLVDAVLHCAAKERKFGAPADEKGKAQRKTAGRTWRRLPWTAGNGFPVSGPTPPDQYRQSVSALFGTVLPAWLQWRNTYVPIGKEGSNQ